jgi:hypothetical protein
MAQNYVLLERIELNASAASVTFSNIPQSGYTDLKFVISARTNSAGANSNPWTPMVVTFNSTTTTSSKQLYGIGSAVGSDSSVNNVYTADTDNTTNTFSNCEIYIPNYTSTNQKSYSAESVTENNAASSLALMAAGLTNVTVAITSVTLAPDTGSFAQYSTFSLYALAAVGTTPAIAPKASGGNITTDGTYWYHTFLASNTFTPFTNLTCDYLVVAGGGGGPGELGGGAGAGGLRSTVTATGGGGSVESPLGLIASTAYTVTIGAGGAGGTGGAFDLDNAVNGNNSVLSTITSTGGGHGAKAAVYTGGSGSGAANNGGAVTGANGTTNQGYKGGDAVNPQAPGYGGGGGGGAGSAGANATLTAGGNGGTGVAISAFATATNTGVSNYYAGGGGGGIYYGGISGGTGGAGGGGTAPNAAAGGGVVGGAGISNTGGGGGAAMRGDNTAGNAKAGGNGGSGIVIIRYSAA